MRRFYFIALVVVNFVFSAVAFGTGWYDSAQVRINTIRKGNFTFRVLDAEGKGVMDSIKIIHRKHEFPWGTAVDLSYTIGGSYSTTSSVSASADAEIYKSERYAAVMGYILPVEIGKKYKVTLKLAEIYFSSANSRLFDVYLDGQKVMTNADKFAMAGGKLKAVDTTFNVTSTDRYIHLKFQATKDNASIMGLVLADSAGTPILRINCGGPAMTTSSGNYYENDYAYADQTVKAPGTSNDDWIKALMLKYCNYGVCGNQFKWSGIESTHGNLTYAPFENTLRWFNDVGWDMRAHTLLWGGTSNTDYHELPQWVGSLAPKNMYDTCKMRVTRELTRYRGKVREYDVLNEPTHATYLQSKVGDSINWNCFKWAHEADPDARLFVNDYNIIEWQDQTNNFVALVRKMLDNGAPVTGIGAQCHIGATTDIVNFKKRFDQLGQFGLPIKVTEFDMGAKLGTDQQYAIEISKMLRLAFSHPAIEGFIFWGITEPTWVPETVASLIREDKTPRIAADSVYHLIHEVWTTRINDITNDTGVYQFNGYYGDYDILVKVGDSWKKFEIPFKKANQDSVFILHESNGMVTSPVLKKVRFYPPSGIELTFDKAMADPSAEADNFKVFDNAANFVQSAALKSGDSATIVLTTKTSFKEKRYIPVSYFPGNVRSVDGGKLESFGPVQDATLTPAFLSAGTNNNGKKILLAFNGSIADTSVKPDNFTAKIGSTVVTVSEAHVCATKDTVYLTLGKQVTSSSSVVTVSYQPGSLSTMDSMYVAAFDSRAVVNNLLETKVISASTTTDGITIQVVFSQLMADPVEMESSFSVSVNGNIVPVTAVTRMITNKRIIVLTLSSVVHTGETVNITYQPGTLMSTIEVPAAGFTAGVINRSKVAAVGNIENKDDELILYPNPVEDQLHLANIEGFNDISLTDLAGRVLFFSEIRQEGEVKLDVAHLRSGVYLVILSGNDKKYFSKIVKK
ncbi:MAG: endo-1,4-beta-xylanase [Bacteroidales bacterium]